MVYMIYIWCIYDIYICIWCIYGVYVVYCIWFLDHMPLARYIYIQYTMYDYIRLYMVYAPTYHMGALPMEYQRFRSLHCQVF